MISKSNKTLTALVNDFYAQEEKLQKPLGVTLFDLLRELLGQQFKKSSDDEIRTFIRKSYDKYIQNNMVPCESQKRASFDRNMRDWLSYRYKGSNKKKFANDINRASILTIAFVLGFSDQLCNEMLLAVNQHPLHRGDVSENIIIHCLKEGKSFSHAEKMYQCFIHIISTDIDIELESSKVSYTGRSKFIKEKIALTDIHNGTTAFDFTREFKELVIEWEKNTSQNTFDDKDIQVIKNLIVLQNYFSMVSQTTLSSIQNNKKINNLESRSFLKRVFNPKKTITIKSTNTISNIFVDFDKAISNRSLSHPTRTFAIMMGIVSWCQLDDTTMSLEEYVNSLLVEELCNFHPLDSAYPDDRFVMELNKYIYKKRGKKTGSIYYHFDNNLDYSVILGDMNNFNTKAEAFQIIISRYLQNSQNTLTTSAWKNSHQFFDFSTFKPKMETENDS